MLSSSAASLAQRLAGAAFDEVCQNLSLQPHDDGYFFADMSDGTEADDTQIVQWLCLPVGEIYPWQRRNQQVIWQWMAGAPLALTTSPDGHDAAASHLADATRPNSQPNLTIAADHWHTCETLGQWSLVQLSSDKQQAMLNIEKAAADWFPRPRPH